AERARLARATGHYRALNDNADYQDVRVGFAPLQFAAGGGHEAVAAAGIRDGGQAFIDFLGPWPDYQPGERTDEWWFGAPLHAMGYGDRGADWMFVGVAALRDPGGHNGYPWEWSEEPVATQAFRLYRNGRLLASAAREPFLQVAVPATRASYRVERDLNLRGLTRLANVSRTRWWFISAAPAGQDPYALLPLLAVDYQAAQLGGRNGAVAGRPVTIHARGAP